MEKRLLWNGMGKDGGYGRIFEDLGEFSYLSAFSAGKIAFLVEKTRKSAKKPGFFEINIDNPLKSNYSDCIVCYFADFASEQKPFSVCHTAPQSPGSGADCEKPFAEGVAEADASRRSGGGDFIYRKGGCINHARKENY